MKDENQRKRITIDSTETYKIIVQGCLEEVWSDRLAGMKIRMNIPVYQDPITTLLGKVKGQFELMGVLNGLYELRIPILSLERLEKRPYLSSKNQI